MPFPTWIRLAMNRMFTKQRRVGGAKRQSLKLQLEPLEDRTVPTTLYVGALGQFVPPAQPSGTAAIWTPGPNFAGFTPQVVIVENTAGDLPPGLGTGFTDLQQALNQAALDYTAFGTADTIDVAPGTFQNDYNITSPVTLQGSNAAGTASTLYSQYQAQPSWTTIIAAPAAAAPPGAYNDVFRVLASNVSISGFVLDGTADGGSGDDGITNFSTDANLDSTQVSNITLQQNIVQNFGSSGIYMDNASPGAGQGEADPTAVSTGNLIQTNYVANNGTNAPGFNQPGIGVFDNFFADIENNAVSTPLGITNTGHQYVEGITVVNFDSSGVGVQPGPMTISGNTVTIGANTAGVYIDSLANSPVTVNLSGNTIQAATGIVETANGVTWGLDIKRISGAAVVSESGDTIGTEGGQMSNGVNVWNTGAANVTLDPAHIGSSTVAPVIGIYLQDNDPVYGFSAAPNSVAVTGGVVWGTSVGLQAAGVANLSVSNTTLDAPTAISGTALTGNAALYEDSVFGSGTSSMSFTGVGPTLTVTTPANPNTVVVNGVLSQFQYSTDQTVGYSGLSTLTVTDGGASGAAVFTVTPAPTGAPLINVNGNPADTDTLSPNLAGLLSPALNPTGPFSGYITSASFTVNNPGVFWTNMTAVTPSAPEIISTPDEIVTNGINNPTGVFPVNFQVVATGSPAPTFTTLSLAGGDITLSATGVLSVYGPTPAGTYNFVITASNAYGIATQNFTLIVNQLPGISPISNATVIIGIGGSLTVSATGGPLPSLSYTSNFPGLSGQLPGGFTFNTPSAGVGVLNWSNQLAYNDFGTYTVTIYANNGSGQALATFTLTIELPPHFTSTNNVSFSAGTGGTFTVTTIGSPAPVLSYTNPTLPTGVTFVQTTQNNVTGTSTGVLTVGANAAIGNTVITFTATNSASYTPPAVVSQTFTLSVVGAAPVITSTNHATVQQGGTFTATATGAPTPTFVASNPVTGVTVATNGVISVTGAAAIGSHTFNIVATNAAGNTTQTFTLTVTATVAAPVFNPVQGTPQVVLGTAGSITVSANGGPAPSISYTSSPGLPGGFILNTSTVTTPTAAGIGVLTWSSALPLNSIGSYTLTFYATNSSGTTTQTVYLGIERPGGPSVTLSPNVSSTTLHVTGGTAGSVTATASGSPTPTLALVGALPAGVSYNPATGVLSWTSSVSALGVYQVAFVASNSLGSYDLNFTIDVVP